MYYSIIKGGELGCLGCYVRNIPNMGFMNSFCKNKSDDGEGSLAEDGGPSAIMPFSVALPYKLGQSVWLVCNKIVRECTVIGFRYDCSGISVDLLNTKDARDILNTDTSFLFLSEEEARHRA